MLSVLIIDDEALARARLRQLLDDLAHEGGPAVRLLGEAPSAAAALDRLAQQPADLLLLDVQMPGLDGMALARLLHEQAQPPELIFISAHGEHALAAFEVEAVDYLAKPVQRERLREALRRAERRRAARQAAPEGLDFLIQERNRQLRVPLREVLYLKAELKYVTLRTATHSHVLEGSLTELEPRLGPGFLRIHRNALVARHAIRALAHRSADDAREGAEAWAVQIRAVDEWLTVSRRQLASVREALQTGVGG